MINPKNLIDNTLLNAELFCENNNLTYRISKIDNCSFVLTDDAVYNRLDLYIKSDKNFNRCEPFDNNYEENSTKIMEYKK